MELTKVDQYNPSKAFIGDDGNVISNSMLRVVAGNCPSCGNVLVIVNHSQMWALVKCGCTWAGDTDSILNKVRLDKVNVNPS